MDVAGTPEQALYQIGFAVRALPRYSPCRVLRQVAEETFLEERGYASLPSASRCSRTKRTVLIRMDGSHRELEDARARWELEEIGR